MAGPLVAALAACQPGPPAATPVTAQIVRARPTEAAERAAARLRAAGFEVTRLASAAVPTLRGELASGADPAWARCAGIWTNDPFSDVGRSRFVQAGGRRTTVVVRVSSLPQGTSVEVDLHTIGLYTHGFTGAIVEARCATTGALERAVLEAAAGPG